MKDTKDNFMKKILVVSLMSCALSLYAGRSTEVGNGGDAVVCEDGTVTLLDSYEAQKNDLTIDIDKVAVSQTLRAMVDVAVGRLSSRDKYMAIKLREYSYEMVDDFEKFEMFHGSDNRFRGNVLYIGRDSVGEISDSEHRTLPEGCELRQLVSQLKPERLRDNRYEFSLSLWEKLSKRDQAMTILHEAIYRIMIEDGATKSRGTRYMNALFASKEFESYSFSDYIRELKTTEKKNYIVQNNSSLLFSRVLKLKLKSLTKDNTIFSGETICTDSLEVKANIKKLRFISSFHRGLAKVKFTDVCFNSSSITSLTMPTKIASSRINFVMESYLVRTNKLLDESAILSFNDNGTLKTIEGLQFEALYKMFYRCESKDGEFISETREAKCKGPFLDHKSKVKKPKSIEFDNDEKPIGYFL
jgi:hypothetical protein